MNIRLILWSFLLVFVSYASTAQRAESKRERMQTLKVAFITEELALTAEQAKTFWPIYDQLDADLKALRKDVRQRPNLDNASDAEMEAWIYKKLNAEEQMAAVKRQYVERFKTVLSWRQIASLMHVEQRFKKELLQRIQERRSQRRGR
jgi:hypothetical protein